MKKSLFLLLSFLFFYYSVVAQLGIGTDKVDSSAMLDVFSTNRGFLPPRVALTATNVTSPVDKPSVGLLIYNTATTGSDATSVSPGYYFWNGNMWYPLSQKGNNVGDIQFWNGKQWVNLPAGPHRSVLTICNGVPTWGQCIDTIRFDSGPSNGQSIYVTYNDSDPNWANGNVYNNTNVNQELPIATSLNGSATITSRVFISFDLNQLPSNVEILSAKLSLFGVPNAFTIPQGNQGDNRFLIQRVTDNWNQTTVTWNTQPPTTTIGQIELPSTTSQWNYDVVGIDVTEMVRAMRSLTPTKTAGFCLRLKDEIIWRSVIFASTRHQDASRRPRLEVVYK